MLWNMVIMLTSANLVAMRRWSLPGIWAYAAFITANNYLQAQRIVRPQVVTSAVVLAIHPPLNWLCIYTLGMLHLSLHIHDILLAVKPFCITQCLLMQCTHCNAWLTQDQVQSRNVFIAVSCLQVVTVWYHFQVIALSRQTLLHKCVCV